MRQRTMLGIGGLLVLVGFVSLFVGFVNICRAVLQLPSGGEYWMVGLFVVGLLFMAYGIAICVDGFMRKTSNGDNSRRGNKGDGRG
jgi:hypothetical protein